VRVGNILLPKSTDRFKKQIEIAKSYIDDNLRTINVTTFNEWHEDTYIEPSVEDTFEYLKVLKFI
jgi:adenine C2-methylase RlmN of 23S rRNA A2503 and tRNA A37